MSTIVIIDYGLGNMRSVSKAVEKAGANVLISHNLDDIRSAEGIILPGVGAFHEGMTQLADLAQALIESEGQVPILGICLGMQMMMEFSEEHGFHKGLGLIPGTVRRFSDTPGYKIPHMGWNQIHLQKQDEPLFERIPDQSYMYFVHSYWADTPVEYCVTSTDYINTFASSIRKGTAIGVQFHPEKSGMCGLSILKNFIGMV
ncbi:MAG TPA: imidazole glycerol phosphate synthase subunit HisH [Methanospirillum sp.]|uniref:imidazole glycerol phosphate synthase subunit HisH n=1 Tax=Methanospirillum sp. TaxID=45200 RepID=UPI002C865991|nr:imidazole glycerol phosphate synthase subunit HisH [Methanospirillum sp.]HOJ96622.1 imidazole glycerol phosphate synthase subunit HisH [Methanospirillum sp.]HOL41411.1 imidazole glycerol phosphate synthase subunit HisH [Methanospirillum sp.]HPP77635.1 imidazole glycerol phosphate synthase subunit HisH [Methanospirillum sp.]